MGGREVDRNGISTWDLQALLDPKPKKINATKEKYMDFTVRHGIIKGEQSDLNQSPEGKRRR